MQGDDESTPSMCCLSLSCDIPSTIWYHGLLLFKILLCGADRIVNGAHRVNVGKRSGTLRRTHMEGRGERNGRHLLTGMGTRRRCEKTTLPSPRRRYTGH